MRRKLVICISVSLLIVFASVTQLFRATTDGGEEDEEIICLKENECDKQLEAMGAPQSVVHAMDDNFKAYICENSEQGEIFKSYDETEMFSSAPNYNVSSASSADMIGSVYVSEVRINEMKYVKIYPSFKWQKPSYLSRDTFAFALYSGWECIPAEPGELTINAVNEDGAAQQKISLEALEGTMSGYGFSVPYGQGLRLPGGWHYEGYTYFYAIKKESSASNGITLKYVYDSSPEYGGDSYWLSMQPGKIDVMNEDDEVWVYSQNLSLG